MLVLDCSMTMAWAFRDETTPGTLRVLELAAHEACVAPSVWPLEVCNAVLTAQRRGRFTSDDVPLFLGLVGDLCVSVDDPGLQDRRERAPARRTRRRRRAHRHSVAPS
jgi:hypothetical protein